MAVFPVVWELSDVENVNLRAQPSKCPLHHLHCGQVRIYAPVCSIDGKLLAVAVSFTSWFPFSFPECWKKKTRKKYDLLLRENTRRVLTKRILYVGFQQLVVLKHKIEYYGLLTHNNNIPTEIPTSKVSSELEYADLTLHRGGQEVVSDRSSNTYQSRFKRRNKSNKDITNNRESILKHTKKKKSNQKIKR